MSNLVIGLEIHVELKTKHKLFCDCENTFSKVQNVHCCPICLGFPGVLPHLNKEAIMQGIKAGLLFGCDLQKSSTFDRKHYQYPDLPKGYQITQHSHPYALGGKIVLEDQIEILLDNLHIEEDAGKSLYQKGTKLLDFNRAGVPLVEIVTTPCITSATQARAVVEAIRDTLVSQGITDGKIQEGSIRCDINVSIQNHDKVEIKNVSGMRNVQKAIEYEAERQKTLIAQGAPIVQETRRWDEATKQTQKMRDKETVFDYCYMPEPDLPLLSLTTSMIQKAKRSLLPTKEEQLQSMAQQYGFTIQEGIFFIAHPFMIPYFEQVNKHIENPKWVIRWLMEEWKSCANSLSQAQNNVSLDRFLPDIQGFVWLLKTVKEGKMNPNNGKIALFTHLASGKAMEEIAKEKELFHSEISETEIRQFAIHLKNENASLVQEYLTGRQKIFAFFMGKMLLQFPNGDGKTISAIVKEVLQGC